MYEYDESYLMTKLSTLTDPKQIRFGDGVYPF